MKGSKINRGFDYASAHDALARLLSRLLPVGQESIRLERAAGRVLSQPIYADRDSPPSDVSAMDGYAVRTAQAEQGGLFEVSGEVAIGQPVLPMPREGCLKIGTGACVPEGCDAILPREQVEESDQAITIPSELSFRAGQHIRFRGENATQGSIVISEGTTITPPVASALAAFGRASVSAYRPVRVAVITTGDELLPIESSPRPWQIRDSNTATLRAALSSVPWIDLINAEHIVDAPALLTDALGSAAEHADLIITTGGVSMGDHDYLKPALISVGGEVVYHKLPIRPGKPSLGGLVEPRKAPGRTVPVVALPGNPVAVAAGLPLLISPVSRMLAGFRSPTPWRPTALLRNPPDRRLNLWQYLPVAWHGDGQVEFLPTKGSGDLAAAARADGFLQIPPGCSGTGPWVFYDPKL